MSDNAENNKNYKTIFFIWLGSFINNLSATFINFLIKVEYIQNTIIFKKKILLHFCHY